ncbi:hypothetical protein GGH99_001072 [Coemansia sp. RSA 1285]|nr:hypothetical protein GGH99_001072 [Coemansia sp. RSA 1285]
MNFGNNNNSSSNCNGGSFAAPSFADKLRMGVSQIQENLKDVSQQFTLTKECERAARILTEFVVPPRIGEIDDIIPADVLQHCYGIAVLTIVKAGFIWSGRIGTGIVCARLPDGTWSGPSAISTGGFGVGGQIGAQMTEVVMILNNSDAVRAFEENASVQFGSNVSVAAGPLGRSGEISAAVNTSNVAAVYSYSKSKGLFAGVSIEGSAVLQRKDVNQAFYGRPAPPEQVLAGSIRPPENVTEWEVLRTVLHDRCTPPPGSQAYRQQQQQQQAYGGRQQYGGAGHQFHETIYDEQDAVHINPSTILGATPPPPPRQAADAQQQQQPLQKQQTPDTKSPGASS